jgi:hypothetical protein
MRRNTIERVEALRSMNERHPQEGVALQQRALQRLQARLEGELTPAEAIRALREGVCSKRLARGEVTVAVQEGAQVGFSTDGRSARVRRSPRSLCGGSPPGGGAASRHALGRLSPPHLLGTRSATGRSAAPVLASRHRPAAHPGTEGRLT